MSAANPRGEIHPRAHVSHPNFSVRPGMKTNSKPVASFRLSFIIAFLLAGLTPSLSVADETLERMTQLAEMGWALYQAGEFSGEHNGGKYTDPDPKDRGYECWSDGALIKVGTIGWHRWVFVIHKDKPVFFYRLNSGKPKTMAPGFESIQVRGSRANSAEIRNAIALLDVTPEEKQQVELAKIQAEKYRAKKEQARRDALAQQERQRRLQAQRDAQQRAYQAKLQAQRAREQAYYQQLEAQRRATQQDAYYRQQQMEAQRRAAWEAQRSSQRFRRQLNNRGIYY